MHRNREPLLHCAVYIELIAHEYDDAEAAPDRCADGTGTEQAQCGQAPAPSAAGLPLRRPQWIQRLRRSSSSAFCPASSVANLYPFNYSGKTDAQGFYIGRDKFGSNILVDLRQARRR
jgi:hypothetical protein